jgi:hypothetical protein
MLAALLCLPVLLLLTSVSLARPLRLVASLPSCSSGQHSMPDLNGLILRSNPRVVATGRLIKGLYYSDRLSGPHALAAFFIVCDRLLEPKPFLVMDFRSHQFSFDRNRDGCADTTGLLLLSEIDPADFFPAVDQGDEICNEDAVSQRWLNGLVGVQKATFRRGSSMPR